MVSQVEIVQRLKGHHVLDEEYFIIELAAWLTTKS